LTGDPTKCSLIHRGPDYSLWTATTEFVDVTNQNIGTVSTKGADLLGHYLLDFGPRGGKLDFALNGTYTPAVDPQRQLVGLPRTRAATTTPGWGAYDRLGRYIFFQLQAQF